IQGTTYTPIAFLPFSIPVISHFGSTTRGFLDAVPRSQSLEADLRKIWMELRRMNVIRELNIRTRRPLRDVAEIEELVSSRADAVIATSKIVQADLERAGVDPQKIYHVPNAIEDYWFTGPVAAVQSPPSIVFLGRIGNDVFTLKLKGIDRLIDLYRHGSNVAKHTIGITTNKQLVSWLNQSIPNHHFYPNLKKDRIPELLRRFAGSVLLIPSRYEGFSLSLIEGMSQGLIPITYPVGVAPEIIVDGQNGFLMTSQKQGKQILDFVLNLSDAERTRLAQHAQDTAKRFASTEISRRLLEVYRVVIKKRPAG
ncbi:glycosyltransferase family 4 protein, partial [Candidatus Uhrbacteria bacterium]|nr:glycosyltransferase family 4 protein [Candidatus Uhrbacteria bacterium]